jgi:hypothetical protein
MALLESMESLATSSSPVRLMAITRQSQQGSLLPPGALKCLGLLSVLAKGHLENGESGCYSAHLGLLTLDVL